MNQVIPKFILKLNTILQVIRNIRTKDWKYQTIVSFTSDGNSILIHDEQMLESQVLPEIFKHNKLSSFVKQLNNYGFKRQRNELNKQVYYHPYFNINSNYSMLQMITKRNKPKKMISFNIFKDDFERFKLELDSIWKYINHYKKIKIALRFLLFLIIFYSLFNQYSSFILIHSNQNIL
ncbi:hypothetical protein pb186bvf_011437 [Paramecium bursaria]